MAAVLAAGTQAAAFQLPQIQTMGAAPGASSSLDLFSSSYFKVSPDRPTTATMFRLRSDFQGGGVGKGASLEAVARVQANAFLSDRSSITPEATEAYFGTTDKFSSLHRFTLGRRNFDWSVADQHWALGNWNSRFLWDPLRPQSVGLIGLTYEYRSRYLQLRMLGSHFNIPERGSPMRVRDGKLYYSNPDAAVPYESVSVMNQNVPLFYSLNMPGLRSLTVNSSLLAQVRVGEPSDGLWASVTGGIKPMNSPDVTAAASLRVLPTPLITADLYPRILSHQLVTFEAGVNSEAFKFWSSVTRENPLRADVPAGRSAAPIGPATVGSLGMDIRFTHALGMSTSILSVREQLQAAGDDGVQIALPSRYRFKNAANLGLDWKVHSRLATHAGWTRDFDNNSSWFTAQARYRSGRAWQLGMTADIFQIGQNGQSGTNNGFLAAYNDNGRVQGTLSYEF